VPTEDSFRFQDAMTVMDLKMIVGEGGKSESLEIYFCITKLLRY
jgi:hypothetical protein